MESVIAALIGAIVGSVATALLTNRQLRVREAEDKNWAYITKLAPVFGALLSSELPDMVSDNSIPGRFKHEWASLAREGSILGFFQDSRSSGITAIVEEYTARLIEYSNGKLSRHELEQHRKESITRIESHLAAVEV
ncbi:hypothetical protein [uncultured Gimesia sp.]|uniref:hypothetical protein n=1 Tax=uncultured Gimesia sp. TaxID=1678688 RepID=UPI0030DD5602|tara:strand:- start:3182 stop:3592 length:411 start_codon:yes stop_codon:yes gene_type:complete